MRILISDLVKATSNLCICIETMDKLNTYSYVVQPVHEYQKVTCLLQIGCP